MEKKNNKLADNFSQYFNIDYAVSAAQKRQVYSIRYNVYCTEFGYESAERFPDKIEFDDYDKQSVHCLITHKRTGIPAACVRLVPTTGQDDLLPFEKFCSKSLDREQIKSLELDRNTICEISRLAVDSAFRKRSGELLTRFGKVTTNITEHEQRSFMLIAIAAFLTTTAFTVLMERTNAFAMMEPFLPRLLKRSGLFCEKVGKDIDYHGIRAPYFLTSQSALDNMNPELYELYSRIFEQIEHQYRKLHIA